MNTTKSITRIMALMAAAYGADALALEESFTCNASGLQNPTKVFSEVTSLAQLKSLNLGGKMGGNSITGQRAYSRVVFVESESSETELVYQFQLCDLNHNNDKHLKIAKVKFTLAEDGGINAQQTAQGYVNNGGDGDQVGTVVTSMNPNGIAAYSVVDLHVSDVTVATADVGGVTKNFGRLSEALSAAETVTLTGAAVPAEGIMITRANNKLVYAGETELELPIYILTSDAAKTLQKGGSGKVKLTGSLPASAPAGSFGKIVAVEGPINSANLYGGMIAVSTDATYEFVGNAGWDYKTPLELAGGTLKSTTAATGGGKVQFYGMTISADSTIEAKTDFYSLGSGYNRFNYNLGGHTLTKTGSGAYMLQTANFVGGGAFDVQEGSLCLRSVSVPSGATLALTLHENTDLWFENGNGKTGSIDGNLDVTVEGGTLHAQIAMPVRNLTMTLNEEAATAIPNNVQLGTTSTLSLTGTGTMTLGTARPSISAIPSGTTLAVTMTAAEVSEDAIKIPTTLESVENVKILRGEDELDATVSDGFITALAQDPNKVVIPDGETLTITSTSDYGSDKTIVVNEGCTLDMNGVGDCVFAIVLNGGKLTNTGRAIGWSLLQAPKITLMANSEIEATSELGSVASGHGQHDINLNGFTLTKTGVGDFWFTNAKFVGGGKIVVEEGTVRFRNGMALDGETTLEIGENGTATFMSNTSGETATTPSFTAIIGEGTLNTQTIPTASLADDRTWTGTLSLENSGTLTGVNVSKLGNENSTVRFNGVRLSDANAGTMPGAVEIVNNGETAGLTFGAWGYTVNFSFGKLTGDGTLATTDFSWYAYHGACRFSDASEFQGSVNFANITKGGMWYVAGDDTPTYPEANDNQPHGAIWVSEGATFGLGGTANSLNAVNTVKGTLKAYTANVALQETAVFVEGSKIDVSEDAACVTLPSTATGAAIVVTGDRVRAANMKVIAWDEAAAPEAFTATLETTDGWKLVRKADGYYLIRDGFTISIH